jgi:hypothetical protein
MRWPERDEAVAEVEACAVEQLDSHAPEGFHLSVAVSVPIDPIDGRTLESTARPVNAYDLYRVPVVAVDHGLRAEISINRNRECPDYGRAICNESIARSHGAARHRVESRVGGSGRVCRVSAQWELSSSHTAAKTTREGANSPVSND